MNRFVIYGIAASVFVVDQLTKHQIVRALVDDRVIPIVPGYFDLSLVHNTGGAFGILPHSTLWLAAAAIIAAVAIVAYTFKAPAPIRPMLGIALALPLGGAIGNLVDRLRLQYVVDFLHVHAGKFDWPVFNVADSCICVGVGLLALYFGARPDHVNQAETPVQPAIATEKDSR